MKPRVPLKNEKGYDWALEEVVLGERERTLYLLWNIDVHFQIPLLIRKNNIVRKSPKAGDMHIQI